MISKFFQATLFRLSDFLKPLIIVPLFIRQFGTSNYGIYAQIFILLNVLRPFIDLGIGYSSQRFFHKKTKYDIKLLRFLLNRELMWGFIISLGFFLSFIVLPTFSNFIFGNNNIGFIIIIPIYLIIYTLNFTYQGICKTLNKIKQLTTLKIVISIFELLMLFLFIVIVKKFSWLYFLVMLTTSLIYFVGLIKITGIFPSYRKEQLLETEKNDIKKFFNYSLLIIPIGFLGWINSSTDKFFISYYFGYKDTGLYSIIIQYTSYIKLMVFPITFAFFVDLSKYFSNNDFTSYYSLLKKIFIYTFFSTLFAAIMFYLFRFYLYKYYVGIVPTSEFLKTNTISILFMSMYNIIAILTMLLNVLKKNHIILYVLIFSALLNMILNYLYVKNFGYFFASISTLICTVFQLLLYLFYVIKYSPRKKTNEKYSNY